MSLESVSFLASGNISPSRFVAGVIGTDYKVFQATASDAPIGISQAGTMEAPGTAADSGYAATSNKMFRVHGPNEVALLELGGNVSAFDYVAPDANGKGIAVSLTATAHEDIGGIALRTGVSGEKIPVIVTLIPARQT